MNGGMENIIGVVGPLATCIADIDLFQRVVLANDPWKYESSLIRMPWSPSSWPIPSKLKIGIIYDDCVVQPQPPISRALQMTQNALVATGHEVVEWDTSLHKEIHTVLHQMFFLDAGQEFRDVFALGNEPMVVPVAETIRDAPEREFTVTETWSINMHRTRLQNAYAEMWNKTDVDFILCPVHPAAAPAHDETRWDAYTGVWNLLDYSAVSFPVTDVRDTDSWERFPRRSEVPLSKEDAWYIRAWMEGGAKKYKNAPVALQVVGRRLEEEKVLGIVEVVKKCLDEF
jgi:amidase